MAMANSSYSFTKISEDEYIIGIGPGSELIIKNDDQCTGSRVSRALTRTDRRGRSVKFVNEGETMVFAVVDGDFGDTSNGVPIFSHIRDAVPERENGEVPYLPDSVKMSPRLRQACLSAGRNTVRVPGGGCPLLFEDEEAVPNFSMSGTGWFLVPKGEIDKLLAR